MNLLSTVPLADSWGMHDGFGWGGMILMMIFMALFWAAVIFGIVWFARGEFTGWRGGTRKETPTEILDRRFAEGNISAEDYQARREVIAQSSR